MKKTTEEMGQLIISLQEIFDVVRLINPTQLEPCIENALSGSNEKRHDYCFRSFQKDQRCENCISLETFTKHKDETKIEFIGRDPYFVLTKYVEVDQYPYVLECALKIHGQLTVGNTSTDFISDMVENNHEKYTNYETGLFNRRYFHEQVKDLPCSGVAIVNIDHLRQINKNFGRAAGDEAIIFVSQVIKLRLRHEDVAIRYGGDDFLIVFRNIEEIHFVERLKDVQSIVHAYANDDFPNLHISVSIGACFEEAATASALLPISEDALEQAKARGDALIIR